MNLTESLLIVPIHPKGDTKNTDYYCIFQASYDTIRVSIYEVNPMKKLVITCSNERLTTPSSLTLLGQMPVKSSFIKKCNNMKVDGKRSQSQIKTDMDVERLPSGKFDTNELVLELTIIAYNILRLIGQQSLKSKNAPKSKHPVKRRRLRTVIGNLIQIAGHITEHGRRIILALGKSNVWRNVFIDIYNRFVTA